jgi:hypothetical protein
MAWSLASLDYASSRHVKAKLPMEPRQKEQMHQIQQERELHGP